MALTALLWLDETPIDSTIETLGVAHCCWVRGWMCLADCMSMVWYWAVLLFALLVDWCSVLVVWPAAVILPGGDMPVDGTLADDMPVVGSMEGDSMPDGDGSTVDDTLHSYGTSRSCRRSRSSTRGTGCSVHGNRR